MTAGIKAAAEETIWRHFGLHTVQIDYRPEHDMPTATYQSPSGWTGAVKCCGSYNKRLNRILISLSHQTARAAAATAAHEAWHALQSYPDLMHPIEGEILHHYRVARAVDDSTPDAVAHSLARITGWPVEGVMSLPLHEREAFLVEGLFARQHEPGFRAARRRLYESIERRGYDYWNGARRVQRPTKGALGVLWLAAAGLYGGRSRCRRESDLVEQGYPRELAALEAQYLPPPGWR